MYCVSIVWKLKGYLSKSMNKTKTYLEKLEEIWLKPYAQEKVLNLIRTEKQLSRQEVIAEIEKAIEWEVGTVTHTNPDGSKHLVLNAKQVHEKLSELKKENDE
jgi:hypothetical protein